MEELDNSFQELMESFCNKVIREKSISFYDWMEYYELYEMCKSTLVSRETKLSFADALLLDDLDCIIVSSQEEIQSLEYLKSKIREDRAKSINR